MRRALVLCLVGFVALWASSAVFAETIISQNFDSDTFPNTYQFTSTDTGLGDSATTVGLWKQTRTQGGTVGTAPTVTTAQAHSGTKSVAIYRNSATNRGFEGSSSTAWTTGQYEASAWLYRPATAIPLITAWAGYYTHVNATIPNYTQTVVPGVYIRTSDGLLGAYGYFYKTTTSTWGWGWVNSDNSQVGYVTNNTPTYLTAGGWSGVKFTVNLSTHLYDVWYDDGNDGNGTVGFTKVMFNVGLDSALTYTVDRMQFYCGGGNNGESYNVDDVLLYKGVIPEPGTLALLAAGLAGLLCYAWRKRK